MKSLLQANPTGVCPESRKSNFLSTLLFTACLGLVAAPSTNRIEITDSELGIAGVRQDMPTIDGFNKQISIREQMSFLNQVLLRPSGSASNQVRQSSAEKTTAILLLGKIRTLDAFQLILKNIKHQDAKTHIYPAIWALAGFESRYETNLVVFIDQSKDELEQSIAVQALTKMVNKRGNYADFLQEQSKRVSPALYKKLLIYTAD
jgi:hypothetical protein